MSENKNETVEKINEEAAEDTILEENLSAAEKMTEAEEKSEAIEEDLDETEPFDKKNISKGIRASVVACASTAVVLVLMVLFNPFKMKSVTKIQKALHIGKTPSYSDGYADTTGRTAGDVAEEMGMAFGEFLVYYDLPDDLPENISENAAINNIPVRIYAEKQLNMSFEDAKALYGWEDDIDKNMTIGAAIDKTSLAKLYGDEQVENLKVLYNLDKDVTGETLYGEVRNELESRIKAEREANEAETEPTEEATEETEATTES